MKLIAENKNQEEMAYCFLLLLASERKVSLALAKIEMRRKIMVKTNRRPLGTMKTADNGSAKFNQHLKRKAFYILKIEID